jgi:hypothetical protein
MRWQPELCTSAASKDLRRLQSLPLQFYSLV